MISCGMVPALVIVEVGCFPSTSFEPIRSVSRGRNLVKAAGRCFFFFGRSCLYAVKRSNRQLQPEAKPSDSQTTSNQLACTKEVSLLLVWYTKVTEHLTNLSGGNLPGGGLRTVLLVGQNSKHQPTHPSVEVGMSSSNERPSKPQTDARFLSLFSSFSPQVQPSPSLPTVPLASCSRSVGNSAEIGVQAGQSTNSLDN